MPILSDELDGQDPTADDSERLAQRTKRAKQFSLEENGLNLQRATGKFSIPTSLGPQS